jgi:hypothetical protein
MSFQDASEARSIAAAEIAKLRSRSYQELLRLMEPNHLEVIGAQTGLRYAAEAQAFWDEGHRGSGNLRVMVSIFPAAEGPMRGMTEDFIVRPDGSFVDDQHGYE